ncbi:MAG: LysR family transcriptional regulator [Candidatus Baltobacteraceae bacterium]|jgi:DNA-binding transcriptional LysR family regulator
MPFTLVQLETFRKLAELGNFSRAAAALHVTQPAVTQQVQALQEHFGVRLVDIVKRRPVLTDAGQFLAARSATLLRGVEALERDMREFAAVERGTLRLGATLTIGAYVLPRLLAAYRRKHPAICVEVEVANTAAMTQLVRGGALGLALVEGKVDGDDLESLPFADDELVLVVPAAGHRFSRRRTVAPRDLLDLDFVSREPGSGTRDFPLEVLGREGFTPRIVLELPSGEAVAQGVAAGLGVAFLSRLVVEAQVALGTLRIVGIEGLRLQRSFKLVRLRAHTPAPAARAFSAIVLAATAPPGRDHGRGVVDRRAGRVSERGEGRKK